MFRCVLATALLFSFIGTAGAQSLPQQPYLKRQFTSNALRGEIAFLNPPEIELNGQPMRLSPGSRVRNQDNMLALSGTLTGQRVKVNYTLDDISHQVKDVWILRTEEIANTPWPKTPAEAQSWRFDTLAQRWAKP